MDRAAIVALDKRFVWHPYTPMRPWLASAAPLVIASAAGSRITDADGRSYLDGNSSWWVAPLGHRHPRLVKVLHEQAERLCHVAFAGITHEPGARLAEELVAVAPPGLERVFYSDDGSTAVEVALKMALQLFHDRGEARRRFVALDGAFHGDTVAATGLGGVAVFRKPFAGLGVECRHVPLPDGEAGVGAAVAALEAALDDSVAALVLEPLLQGAAGMRCYPASYLQAARRACDARGALLIFDEVFTGYGRCGTMWACEQAAVSPDILCVAKGFCGGILPMAATLTTAAVFEAFLGDGPDGRPRALYHGHTFCGHPLGAAIAREVLAVFRDERILERAQPKMARIRSAIDALAPLPGVRAARSIGMVGALDLAGGGYLGEAGWRVYQRALERGAYLRPLGDTVYLAPPLNIDDDDLDTLLSIFSDCVRSEAG